MGPKIELLEHHAELGAHMLDLALVLGPRIAVAILDDLDVIAMQMNAPGGRHFEQIDAAQEGALARARSAEDRDDVVFLGGQ